MEETKLSRLTSVLTAVILAVGVWYYAQIRGIGSEMIEVPLNIIPKDPGLAIVAPRGKPTIKLTVTGPKRDVEAVKDDADSGQIACDYDLKTGASEITSKSADLSRLLDRKSLILKRTLLNIPVSSSISVQNVIEPVRLSIVVSPIETKSLRVKLRLKGDPDEGYVISSYSVKPAWVDVKGPRSVLADRDEIETEPVLLRSRDSTFSNYEVRVVSELDGQPVIAPQNLYAKVVIEPEKKTRPFKAVTVLFLLSDSDDYTYELAEASKTVDVTVEGSERDLKELKPDQIMVFVDTRSIADKDDKAATGTPTAVPLTFKLPPRISVSNPTTRSGAITITRRETEPILGD